MQSVCGDAIWRLIVECDATSSLTPDSCRSGSFISTATLQHMHSRTVIESCACASSVAFRACSRVNSPVTEVVHDALSSLPQSLNIPTTLPAPFEPHETMRSSAGTPSDVINILRPLSGVAIILVESKHAIPDRDGGRTSYLFFKHLQRITPWGQFSSWLSYTASMVSSICIPMKDLRSIVGLSCRRPWVSLPLFFSPKRKYVLWEE